MIPWALAASTMHTLVLSPCSERDRPFRVEWNDGRAGPKHFVAPADWLPVAWLVPDRCAHTDGMLWTDAPALVFLFRDVP